MLGTWIHTLVSARSLNVEVGEGIDIAQAPSKEIKTDGIINLSESAMKQVAKLRQSKDGDLVLRVGVRSGGCR